MVQGFNLSTGAGLIVYSAPSAPTRCDTDAMDSSPQMVPEEVLRVKLEALRHEHRDLDEAIQALEEKGTADLLTLRRLKKQKLRLKDEIAAIEDKLTPDIIA